jgi:hypothetical protein
MLNNISQMKNSVKKENTANKDKDAQSYTSCKIIVKFILF